jgi:hypothetical protein
MPRVQRPGRGRIEVITKAGSDAYHGSLDVTFRDARLNARSVCRDARARAAAHLRRGGRRPFINGKTTSFLVTVDRREEDLQSIVCASRARWSDPGERAARHARRGSVGEHRAPGRVEPHLLHPGDRESDTVDHDGVGGTTLPEAGWNQQSDEAQLIVGDRWIASKSVLHEWRFLVGRETQSTVSLSPDVRVVVLDAFTGGSAQNDLGTTENHFTFADGLTILHGRHVWKAGFAIPDWSWRGFDERINRAGTFTFGSLDEYGAGQPLSFTQQRGDGALSFLQKVFAIYVQDQIAHAVVVARPRRPLRLAERLHRRQQPGAARVARLGDVEVHRRARGAGGSTTAPAAGRSGDPARAPLDCSATGCCSRRIQILCGGGMDTLPPAIRHCRARIRIPTPCSTAPASSMKSTKARPGRRPTSGPAAWTCSGRVTYAPPPPFYEARPDSTLGQVRQIGATGRQTLHSLQLTARGRFTPRVQGPSNTARFRLQRHKRYLVAARQQLRPGQRMGPRRLRSAPSPRGARPVRPGPVAELRGLCIRSVRKTLFHARTGQDDFSTGQTNARPEGVARNTLPGPDYVTVDVRWSHAFEFGSRGTGERPGIAVGVDAFNLCNRVNYDTYVGTLTSPFFGSAVAALPPRRVQVSAGVKF